MIDPERIALKLRGERRGAQGGAPSSGRRLAHKRTIPLKTGRVSFKRLAD